MIIKHLSILKEWAKYPMKNTVFSLKEKGEGNKLQEATKHKLVDFDVDLMT